MGSAISRLKERFLRQILRFMSASLSLRLGLQLHLLFLAKVALLRVLISSPPWSFRLFVPVTAFFDRYRKLMNILR